MGKQRPFYRDKQDLVSFYQIYRFPRELWVSTISNHREAVHPIGIGESVDKETFLLGVECAIRAVEANRKFLAERADWTDEQFEAEFNESLKATA